MRTDKFHNKTVIALGRTTVVALALVVLHVRVPTYFAHPQFWAEDGIIWQDAYLNGLASLVYPLAGYFNSAGRLISLFAAPFPPAYAPTIYFYAAVTITLSTVYYLTSPRLDIPYRFLPAIAVVSVYQGVPILGTAANVQWIVPISLFALLFTRPPKHSIEKWAEYIFLFIAGLTGPFSILLWPLFVLVVWRDIRSNSDHIARATSHAVIVCCCAAAQVACIVLNLNAALPEGAHQSRFGLGGLAALSNNFWQIILSPIEPTLFSGRSGAILGALLAAILYAGSIALTLRAGRFRFLAFCCLFFSTAILLSGLVKVGFQDRYFYVPSILMIIFATCLIAKIPSVLLRRIALFGMGLLLGLLIIASRNTEHFYRDYKWEHYAARLKDQTAITIPIAPDGWFIALPARGRDEGEISTDLSP